MYATLPDTSGTQIQLPQGITKKCLSTSSDFKTGRIYFSEKQDGTSKDDEAFVEMGDGWNVVWNLTNVDSFILPMQLQINYDNGTTQTVGIKSGNTRDGMIHKLEIEMKAAGDDYPASSFFKGNKVIAPGKVSYSGDDKLWSSAIQDGLNSLVKLGQNFSITYGPETYKNFQSIGGGKYSVDLYYNANLVQTVTIWGVNSYNAAAGEIPSDEKNISDKEKQGHRFAALIGSAINRGVLGTPSSWSNQDDYFQGSNRGYNVYAKVIHENSIDKKAYGFSYSDYYGHAAALSLGDANPGSVTLRILPLSNANTVSWDNPNLTVHYDQAPDQGKGTASFNGNASYQQDHISYSCSISDGQKTISSATCTVSSDNSGLSFYSQSAENLAGDTLKVTARDDSNPDIKPVTVEAIIPGKKPTPPVSDTPWYRIWSQGKRATVVKGVQTKTESVGSITHQDIQVANGQLEVQIPGGLCASMI